ncbi:MAG TPA: TIGR03986 family CRISPR-associated RAMP protein [Methanothrix sp.]|nr:TIGR03986 family CRISPR-associated RAMP protein [Methanothrix sp.]
MNPKHHNPTQERRAHAPYNFVPLPEKVVTVDLAEIPGHDVYTGYTGYIDCILKTRSPLYTRCALDPDFFARWGDDIREMMKNDAAREQYAQFFHLDDAERPVIPGSSLRGMVRALVEIAGYGKMQWVTGEKLVYRAVADPSSLGQHYRQQLLGGNKASLPNTHLDYPSPNLRGGYLIRHRGGWAIRPARDIQGETFVHVDYKDANAITNGFGKQKVYEVYVEPARRQSSNRGKRGPGDLTLDLAITRRILPRGNQSVPSGMEAAVLVESGHMGGPHPKHWHCAIYEPDDAAAPIPIPDEMWRTYYEDSQMTRSFPARRLEKEGDPLFYLVDEKGSLVFFGPTMMLRLPYPQTPFALIPPDLRQPNDIDLAEAIFGWVPEAEREQDRAGRVFFTDAVCEPGEQGIWLSEETITPCILASPKPTTFQHYLVQDKDKGRDPDNKQQLAHYAIPPSETSIRGHKLYWHQGAVKLSGIREQGTVNWSTDTQHTSIKPVRTGVRFRFRIYFENLRDFELGALLWALTLPGEPGKDYCHSLGMGKPLGMGAVKITPTLYLSDRQDRYSRLFADADWHRGEKQETDTQPFIRAFEDFVLNGMGTQERGKAQSLKEVERIKMLLKMLEWPGPDRSLTEYMVIGPTNEYKERPVLPDPLHVKPPQDTPSSQKSGGGQRGGYKSGKRRGRR